MPNNGTATADDFRNAALAEAFEKPQRIVLPKSGFAVILRRPRPIAFTLLRHPLPQSLATRLSTLNSQPSESRVEGQESRATDSFSPEELAVLARRSVEMLSLVFVEPKLSMNPGPAEIHPNWLPAEDQTFIVRWVAGEVEDGGSGLGVGVSGEPRTPKPESRNVNPDLGFFRRADVGPSSPPRADGGNVESAPLSAAEGTDIRLPD